MWFLINRDTLKGLKRDADAYYIVQHHLFDAQSDLDNSVRTINLTNRKLHDAEVRVAELENPPVYMNPVLWGSVGLVVGFGTAVALAFFAGLHR